jgi:CxxC motif-containing protein (DUF1111 family)
MNHDDCDVLVSYVRNLPAPPNARISDVSEDVVTGALVFERVGCATCHTPKLGDVDGIYSDLALHDMGSTSADAAVYYGSPGLPIDLARASQLDDPLPNALSTTRRTVVRSRNGKGEAVNMAQEWRTPPLWGVADSAPYMHNGRAQTLEHAIQFHDGEATLSVQKYQSTSDADRKQLLAFLGSLKAPKFDRRSSLAKRE